MTTHAQDVGTILGRVAEVSVRPRHAFMVLDLISKVANGHGKAGSVVAMAVRKTNRLSGRDKRGRQLREAVRTGLAVRTDRPLQKRAGLLQRHHAGWCNDHRNQVHGRHAVYRVDAQAFPRLGSEFG